MRVVTPIGGTWPGINVGRSTSGAISNTAPMSAVAGASCPCRTPTMNLSAFWSTKPTKPIEPTNHLDVQHQLSILHLVAKLPITSVVALHDLNQALSCDRVGVMLEGRLVALGPPHDVLTVERIGAVFGVRASILIDPADGTQMFRFHPAARKEVHDLANRDLVPVAGGVRGSPCRNPRDQDAQPSGSTRKAFTGSSARRILAWAWAW